MENKELNGIKKKRQSRPRVRKPSFWEPVKDVWSGELKKLFIVLIYILAFLIGSALIILWILCEMWLRHQLPF